MVDVEQVKKTLEMVRPSLQADGGDVEFVGVDEAGVVTVELQGHCAGCAYSQMTLSNGIERVLVQYVPGVTKVVSS